jgi:hypothetical protein
MRTTPVSFALFGCFALGLLGCMPSAAHAAIDCATARPLANRIEVLNSTPIAEELAVPVMSDTGLRQASSKGATVEVVLSRIQHQECLAIAAAAANAPKPVQGGGSYRFNMTQGGKRMTADEFDAWMKAQGVRVVKSPIRTDAPTVAAQPAPPPPPKKKKR